MSERPKTIPEITSAMRDEGHTGPSDCLEWVQTKMQFYADQLDEAFKRYEKTSLDQICDAVNLAGHERYLREHGEAQTPKRNCDAGTLDEQVKRFEEYCRQHKHPVSECLNCPLLFQTGGHCELAWAQLPYEEGDIK